MNISIEFQVLQVPFKGLYPNNPVFNVFSNYFILEAVIGKEQFVCAPF